MFGTTDGPASCAAVVGSLLFRGIIVAAVRPQGCLVIVLSLGLYPTVCLPRFRWQAVLRGSDKNVALEFQVGFLVL